MRGDWKQQLADERVSLEDIWFSGVKNLRLYGGGTSTQNHQAWVDADQRAEHVGGRKVIKNGKGSHAKGVMIALAADKDACSLLCSVEAECEIHASYYLKMVADHFLPELTYRRGAGRPFVWQQDNAPSRKSAEAQGWIGKNAPKTFRCPPKSPDLTPSDVSEWDFRRKKSTRTPARANSSSAYRRRSTAMPCARTRSICPTGACAGGNRLINASRRRTGTLSTRYER